jgi:phenylacetate-CoA ligase
MLQKMRKKAFWISDRLKGSSVKEHYEDISQFLGHSNQLQRAKDTQNKLKSLIKHAINTSAYYSGMGSDAAITDFPVIDKIKIRDEFDAFLSSSYSEKECAAAVTSGSTGTPFKVYHNQDKKNRNTADTLYFANKAGYKLGHRLYYLKIWNEINKKSWYSSFFQNLVPVDVMDQSTSFFETFIDNLNQDKSDKSFLGYASAFEEICKYLDQKNIEKVSSNVKSIIAMSESLNGYTKVSMKKYFDCEVVSRYSNVENGILAQQEKGEDEAFYLNTASYYFELLELGSKRPVSQGEPGRIVVTDLYNYAMPMIRYDTGDVGILSENHSGQMVLKKVEGRRMDMIYDTSGKLVSSFVITNNMWKYNEIIQYQFIQESQDNYRFIINTNGKFEREKELINEFSDYFGLGAKIQIEYVSEIPLLSSGKRKKVVNNWK